MKTWRLPYAVGNAALNSVGNRLAPSSVRVRRAGYDDPRPSTAAHKSKRQSDQRDIATVIPDKRGRVRTGDVLAVLTQSRDQANRLPPRF
jgi:hypothetical protein